jgi:leucyl-tRNA synthetase
MEYDFQTIEKKWQARWNENNRYQVKEDSSKKKYYILDMFPYPSGAGLHVGHPLGYIASDIIARYKRHQGYNVLHPMGYDSFGLPAEQYAIQTGQHPAITTEKNIARYREQLDKLGFSFDWSREVRTSDPSYYQFTQWIFTTIYASWFNVEKQKTEPIATLVAAFENNGNYNIQAACDDQWYKNLLDLKDNQGNPLYFFDNDWNGDFSATDWKSMNDEQRHHLLMCFRLTYLADSMVNWCPALGTVLANDEVKDGVSERGGHPVIQKKMRQWSMRISAFAERLLHGLEQIDWPENIKEIQRNWIGKSEGATMYFDIANHPGQIEVFTTRPDTMMGVAFVTLAPEHPLVPVITTDEQRATVEHYIAQAALKNERDRQMNVKEMSGVSTGAFAIHPITGNQVPIYIADYVLAGYGTGAVMAVPAGDQRDWDFAKQHQITFPLIFKDHDANESACTSKEIPLINSDFLNGLCGKEAFQSAVKALETRGKGGIKTNYRLRDAVFSRQRYWGEPFPVYFENGIPKMIPSDELPVQLPAVDKYLPTEDGEPPLARSQWKYQDQFVMEYNTMPGWAGSSWYFLRYMDPHNKQFIASPEAMSYWGQVDLYMGGAEHATGHLLYSRFWTMILHDLGYVPFGEPFQKMINQGMILGRSSFVYRIKDTQQFVSADLRKEYPTQRLYADISLVDNDKLDVEKFKKWLPEYADATFVLNDNGDYLCGFEIEKMSKSKYNVQTPDELVEKFGADTLRCYEMFLGPVEQSKPWDTKGINGVHNFLRRLSRLYKNEQGEVLIVDENPEKKSLQTLHRTIKKVSDDLNRYSWNTVVSTLMIAVNEFTEQKCHHREILNELAILLSPYAPHLAEDLWETLGHTSSILDAPWPQPDNQYLEDDTFSYPVSFNGKMRFNIDLAANMETKAVEAAVLAHEKTTHYLEGKPIKKMIVVPKRIVNIVF